MTCLKQVLLFALLIVFCFSNMYAQTSLPNVVVVLADDVGYGDIAKYREFQSLPKVVSTPALDLLISEGMHFTDAHSPAALCAPSRYAFLTGKNCYYQAKPLGQFNAFGETQILPIDVTLGELMQNAGYKTSFFGKWHVGADFNTNDGTGIYSGPKTIRENAWQDGDRPDISRIVSNGPNDQGFDYSFTFLSGIQANPFVAYENKEWYKLGANSAITYLDEDFANNLGFEYAQGPGVGESNFNPFDVGPVIVDKAVDYIKNNAGGNKPFFMYYCSQAVHIPHTPADSLGGKNIKGTTPSSHLDMVKELDAQMSVLIKTLKDEGVYDNTVFMFISDNGGLRVKDSENAGHRASGILNGKKGSILEGGHRVPLIVSWPGMVAPNSKYEGMISGVDIVSTLAAITNQTLPDNTAPDSFNFLPILEEDNNAPERKIMMLQAGSRRQVGIREGDYKLTMQYQNSDKDLLNQFRSQDLVNLELYNLATDLREQNNLLNDPNYTTRIKRMRDRYIEIRDGRLPTKVINSGGAPPSNDEQVSLATVPASLDQSASYTFDVDYTVTENRRIVVAIRRGNQGLKSGRAKVSAGSGNTTITVTPDDLLAPGNNYKLIVSIKSDDGNNTTIERIEYDNISVGGPSNVSEEATLVTVPASLNQSASYTFDVDYTVTENRRIVVAIRQDNKWLKSGRKKVSAGSGNISIKVTPDNLLAPGNNYQLVVSIKSDDGNNTTIERIEYGNISVVN